jgi:D-sedoheptulose 7-phosphate isomerase
MIWAEHVKKLSSILNGLSVDRSDGSALGIKDAFLLWKETTLLIREQKKTIYLIGNGASASMASHVAADLAKNVHVRAEVFSDLSLITALANDMGYENVFVEPLRRRMCAGDMLVAISSSGQSPNVIRATEEAKHLGGFVVTLSAMKQDNRLKSMGMINFYVPAESYGLAETCHAAILHCWIDQTIDNQA